MNAGRSQGFVKMECASTWLAASGVSVQWDSSITTSYWFVKVSVTVPHLQMKQQASYLTPLPNSITVLPHWNLSSRGRTEKYIIGKSPRVDKKVILKINQLRKVHGRDSHEVSFVFFFLFIDSQWENQAVHSRTSSPNTRYIRVPADREELCVPG